MYKLLEIAQGLKAKLIGDEDEVYTKTYIDKLAKDQPRVEEKLKQFKENQKPLKLVPLTDIVAANERAKRRVKKIQKVQKIFTYVILVLASIIIVGKLLTDN